MSITPSTVSLPSNAVTTPVTNVGGKAIEIISDRKAVASEGNLGAGLLMSWGEVDRKAIISFNNGMFSHDASAWQIPFWNMFRDSAGKGQQFWLVQHGYLNKGRPNGGASIPFNRPIITTESITTATGTDHLFTVPNHGFVNGQDIVPWVFSGHDTQSGSRFFGFPHSMGMTLYVNVVDANTFKLHTGSSMTTANRLRLHTSNFPSFGTTGTFTYTVPTVVSDVAYSSVVQSYTITQDAHGYDVGEQVATPQGVRIVASVPNANTYTYQNTDITVTSNAHGLSAGQWVSVTNVSGGITQRWYRITAVTTNTFTLNGVTNVNETGTLSYRRPVTITDTSHGCATGDFVRLAPTSGDLATGVYGINVLTANTYEAIPANYTQSSITTGGGGNVRRRMFACFLDAWDWHGHTSIETAWRDGTVNTMEGWTYGLNYPLKRTNTMHLHYVACSEEFTNEPGTFVDRILGRNHNDPRFSHRLNSVDNYNLIAYSQDGLYTPSSVYTAFQDGTFQMGGGNTQLMPYAGFPSLSVTRARNSLATANTTNPQRLNAVGGATSGGRPNVWEEMTPTLELNLTTTPTNLVSIPLPNPTTTYTHPITGVVTTYKLNCLSIIAELTVIDTTGQGDGLGGSDTLLVGTFTVRAVARRHNGGTILLGTPTVTQQVSNLNTFTASNITVTATAGNLIITVTADSNTKRYVVNSHIRTNTYMTP